MNTPFVKPADAPLNKFTPVYLPYTVGRIFDVYVIAVGPWVVVGVTS